MNRTDLTRFPRLLCYIVMLVGTSNVSEIGFEGAALCSIGLAPPPSTCWRPGSLADAMV